MSMEMQHDNDMTLEEKAWEAFKQAKLNKEDEEDTDNEALICSNNDCSGTEEDFITDSITADTVCTLCGTVIHNLPSEQQEWNNWSEGEVSFDKGRCGFVSDTINPFNTPGSMVVGLKMSCKMPDGTYKDVNLSKYSWQSAYTHKQKTFYQTTVMMNDIGEKCGVPKKAIDTARIYWAEIMKSGKLLRGAPRKGIILSCIVYACNRNNIAYNAKRLAKNCGISSKEITRGDKIFRELFEGTEVGNVIYEQVNYEELFSKYLNTLNLPYKLFQECCSLYELCEEYLDDVNIKSKVAGILVYLVKNIYKIKSPTKTKISKELDVCNPTINKVIKKIIKIKEISAEK